MERAPSDSNGGRVPVWGDIFRGRSTKDIRDETCKVLKYAVERKILEQLVVVRL